MGDDAVDYVEVEFEDVGSSPGPGDEVDSYAAEPIASGESVVRVPLLTGSLPPVKGSAVILTRESSASSSSGFELKIFSVGAGRTAKITVKRSTQLELKPGETKTRFIEVPVAWQTFADPNRPGETITVVTPGIPPDGRYDVRVDMTRLPTAGSTSQTIDNDADGVLTDTDAVETARGSSFALAFEAKEAGVSATVKVGVERATTTTVKYSLPRGSFALEWLSDATGVYISRR
ncbi:hypothetical protein [Microbacterium aurantiacum]|uniref:hypothetical protein n=1 Tax=Microbacterium aurantiacum TaxID=162393 RepID=UPI003D7086E4